MRQRHRKDHVIHPSAVTGEDQTVLAPVVLHVLKKGIQRDVAEIHGGVLLEKLIGFIYEKSPASGALKYLLNVVFGLTDMGSDEPRPVCLYKGVGGEYPGPEQHLSDDPRDGALACSGVAADDEVHASLGGFYAETLSSERVHLEPLEYAVKCPFDLMHADDITEQLLDLR